MTDTEVQVRLLMAWARTHLQARATALREQDPERGDGILASVVMVALLVAAAIAIVAIIVAKAKDTANKTQTQ